MPYLFIWMKTFSSFLCKSSFKFISHLVQWYLFSKCALGPHFRCPCEVCLLVGVRLIFLAALTMTSGERVGVENVRFYSWVVCEPCKCLQMNVQSLLCFCCWVFRCLPPACRRGEQRQKPPFKPVWVCDLVSTTPSPSHPPPESWGRLIPGARITHMQLVHGFFSHLFQSFRRKRYKQTNAVWVLPIK